MKALQLTQPETRLDGGSYLKDANFDTSPDNPHSALARTRYQLTATDYSAALWLVDQGVDRKDIGLVNLAKLMMLKHIESLGDIPALACARIERDPVLKAQLIRLANLGSEFESDVYLHPADAELVKRIQASRSRLFALAVSARNGDGAARAEVVRLSALVARDPFTPRAVKVYDAFESMLPVVYAKANAGSRDGAYAFAALRVESYSQWEARDFQAKLDVQQTLAVLQESVMVMQVTDALLKASDMATAKDVQCGEPGLNYSPLARREVDRCREEFDARWLHH